MSQRSAMSPVLAASLLGAMVLAALLSPLASRNIEWVNTPAREMLVATAMVAAFALVLRIVFASSFRRYKRPSGDEQ